MHIRTHILVAALALGLPACSSHMGSVNLSSRDSRVAVDAVNHPEAQAIQAAVIAAARERHPVSGDASFLLLTGSDYKSYQAVGATLGQGFVLPDQAAAGQPFYGIRSLHSDGHDAEVAVVYSGKGQLIGESDADVVLQKTADGKAWRVTRVTERAQGFNSVAELLAAEAQPKAASQSAPNWMERNLLGKKTEEQKAQEAAKAEAKAKAKADKEAAEQAEKAAKAQAKAEKEAADKAAADAKAAEEAKQPKKYNWFERNIEGKKTEEQKAAEAAEKEAKAKAKADKEAAEQAEKAAKAQAKADKEAADKAAADAKAAEEAKQPKHYNWFERNILGKKNPPAEAQQ